MLEHLKPERVFYYFEEISKIPRGSYNTKQVSDYCVSVAHELGLSVRQDKLNNVVIKKPASKGYEHVPVLMLQGHLDMVCEKEAGIEHDFEHDGLDLMITEDGYVTADGTTLGGDDGIAVAYALAILEDDSLIHPPLEVVLTTEEEVGMDGALGLDTSDLYAKYLLNLDSEDEGILTVSCAGGSTVELHIPYEVDESFSLTDRSQIYMLRIQGLQGGHSGVEIDKGRANSNKLMAILLQELALTPNLEYRLISIQGGLKHNAIPRETTVYLALQSEADVKQITGSIGRYQQLFSKCYGSSDSTIEILFESCGMEFMVKNGHVPENTRNEHASADGQDKDCSKQDVPKNDFEEHGNENIRVMTRACSDRLIRTLYVLPNGLQAMSQSIPGLPETSLNLGVLRTDEQEIYIELSNRSSNPASLELLENQLETLAKLNGCAYVKQSEYPGWEYLPESRLRDTMCTVYEELFHKQAKIEAIHAGLECGILASKMHGLDIVSTGPDILDIHTPQERMSIASVERTYEYVRAVITRLAEQA